MTSQHVVSNGYQPVLGGKLHRLLTAIFHAMTQHNSNPIWIGIYTQDERFLKVIMNQNLLNRKNFLSPYKSRFTFFGPKSPSLVTEKLM